MRMFERFAAIIQMTAFLGPANLVSLLLAACLSSLYYGYRMLSQGYHRCFFSTK